VILRWMPHRAMAVAAAAVVIRGGSSRSSAPRGIPAASPAARLISQFASLERRSTTSGRDRVDHGPNGADDCSNAAALVLAARASGYLDYAAWVGDPPEGWDRMPYFSRHGLEVGGLR
jgi:hypothetical protein